MQIKVYKYWTGVKGKKLYRRKLNRDKREGKKRNIEISEREREETIQTELTSEG